MKKLILIIALLVPFVLSAQTKLTYKTSEVQTLLDKIDASFPSYVIEEISGTVYARPSVSSGYTTYSDTNLTSVLQNAINELTIGGVIHIKTGIYDNMDSVGITNDYITIEGDGWGTILKLKNGFDTNRPGVNGSRLTGLIALRGGHYTTIKNLQLDGNATNQTKIDDNNVGNGYYGFVNGIAGRLDGQTPDFFTLENCYIHDFPNVGVNIDYSNGSVIKDSYFKDNGSNGISIESGATNTLVDNVTVEGGGDVGITFFGGSNNICQHFIVRDVDGSNGTTGGKHGVSVEGGVWTNGQPTKNKFLHGKISGVGMLKGMNFGTSVTAHPLMCLVDDVEITTIGGDGLEITSDSASMINNVRIYNVTGTPMTLYHPTATRIYNITISSPASSLGIYSSIGSKNLQFDNINVCNINGASATGIKLLRDTASIVRNCFVYNTGDISVLLQGCREMVWDNLISNKKVYLQASSTYYSSRNLFKNSYFNNPIEWDDGVSIAASCDSNIFQSNVFTALSPSYGISDAGSETITLNNYGFGNGKYKETGLWKTTRTATADGLTTGVLLPGSQNVTITSANAAYIVTLPRASATTIGTKITGIVTANGCELRVQAAQATTVYINGVTTNVEAAIPANSSFEITCIDATHWILKVWDAAGAYSAPIPDAV